MISFTFVGLGVLLCLLSLPLIRRLVKPNAFYGLRIEETLSDERVWYEANESSGWDVLGLGLGIIVAAALLGPIGLDPIVYGLVLSGLLLLSTIVLVLRGFSHARRIAAEEPPQGAAPCSRNGGRGTRA